MSNKSQKPKITYSTISIHPEDLALLREHVDKYGFKQISFIGRAIKAMIAEDTKRMESKP